jgi:hypothetical protein
MSSRRDVNYLSTGTTLLVRIDGRVGNAMYVYIERLKTAGRNCGGVMNIRPKCREKTTAMLERNFENGTPTVIAFYISVT